MIRGLVEYGWPDLSRAHGRVPPGTFGGFDLQRLTASEGREGLELLVPAAAGGQTSVEDGTYHFEVKVCQTAQGLGFAVRCPEANFLQEFPYDPHNPLWAAGYIHQALTGYVPQFVQWRLQGGEVAWADRVGMPKIPGEPCSPLLVRFLERRLQSNQGLDQGPAEGWWLQAAPAPAEAPGPSGVGGGVAPPTGWSGAPVIRAGKGAGDPVYLSAQAREMVARGEPIATSGNVQALARVNQPGSALMLLAGLGMAQALLWFINAITVIVYYLDDSLFALFFSLFAALTLLASGAVAMLGGYRYRKLAKGPLPIIAMVYAAVVPVCCLAGIPVAIWAAFTLQDPMVKQARG